ncbi:MAG TPA: hypothetical protein VMS17_23250, partial [Gemmataceae bacterium]|nr:hypothetical protein [Gemmataceae bacterium]
LKGTEPAPNPSDPPDQKLRSGFVWVCLFGPDAVADFALFSPLIHRAQNTAQDPNLNVSGRFQLAALHYRAGHFTEADRLLTDILKDGAHPRSMLFEAMTAQRLGRTEEAKHWLEEAVAWMSDEGQAALPQAQRKLNSSWEARLELSLLRREAEAVLKEPAPKPDK